MFAMLSTILNATQGWCSGKNLRLVKQRVEYVEPSKKITVNKKNSN